MSLACDYGTALKCRIVYEVALSGAWTSAAANIIARSSLGARAGRMCCLYRGKLPAVCVHLPGGNVKMCCTVWVAGEEGRMPWACQEEDPILLPVLAGEALH